MALKGEVIWSGGLEGNEENGFAFSRSSDVDLCILCQPMRDFRGNNLSSINGSG